jgi:uncharacterized protein YcaQ
MIQKISLKKAQNLMIQGQLLGKHSKSPLEILEGLGYVQIDTISVVERAHHHVFWSRCPKYQSSDLDGLISSRKAFEYWSHAAAYLPMKDYRYSLFGKKRFKKNVSGWWPRDPKVMKYVYDRIKSEGPLQSKDFKREKGTSNGWWDWKPTKKALERLFLEGALEISSRKGFHKVYDLSERVIPSKVNKSTPTDSEYAQYLIRRTLDHHVLATPREMAYLQSGDVKKMLETQVDHLVENGDLFKMEIAGLKDPHYIQKNKIDIAATKSKHVHILSPFDNLVIQRRKLSNIFDFDYQIECYVPEAKRKFGYFSLPILVDGQFVARVDCKADRKHGVFLIQSFYWEKKEFRRKYEDRVMKKLIVFAKFNSSQLDPIEL